MEKIGIREIGLYDCALCAGLFGLVWVSEWTIYKDGIALCENYSIINCGKEDYYLT